MSLQSPLFTISYRAAQEFQKEADWRQVLQEALDSIKGFKDQAGNAISEGAGKVRDVVGGAAGKVKDMAGKAEGAISGAAGKAKDMIGGAAGRVREGLEGAAKSTGEVGTKAWNAVSGGAADAANAGKDFLSNYQNEILAGLTGAGVMGGAYGLTATRRAHETDEEFRHRRNMGILSSALMGGGLAGAAIPAYQWMTGSGGEKRWGPTVAKDVTGTVLRDRVGVPRQELHGLPRLIEEATGSGTPFTSAGGPGLKTPVAVPGIPKGTPVSPGPDYLDSAVSDIPKYLGGAGGGYLGQRIGATQSRQIAKNYHNLIASEGSSSLKAVEDLLAENPHLGERVRWDKPWPVQRWQTLAHAPDKLPTAFPPNPRVTQGPPGALGRVNWAAGEYQLPPWLAKLTGKANIKPGPLQKFKVPEGSAGGSYPRGATVPSMPPPKGYKGPPMLPEVPITGPKSIPGRMGGKVVPATQVANEIARLKADIPAPWARFKRWAPQAAKRTAWRGGGGILGTLLGALAADYGGDRLRDYLRAQNLAAGNPIPLRQWQEAAAKAGLPTGAP